MTEKQIKTNLLNIDVWIRLVFMALFALLIVVARIIILIVAALQFLLVLITGRDNNNLRDLGQGVSKWVYQGLLFLTFNTDEKPFPFSDWPKIKQTEPYIAPEPESKEAAEKEQPDTGEPDAADAKVADNDVPSFTEDVQTNDEEESTAKSDEESDDSTRPAG